MGEYADDAIERDLNYYLNELDEEEDMRYQPVNMEENRMGKRDDIDIQVRMILMNHINHTRKLCTSTHTKSTICLCTFRGIAKEITEYIKEFRKEILDEIEKIIPEDGNLYYTGELLMEEIMKRFNKLRGKQ